MARKSKLKPLHPSEITDANLAEARNDLLGRWVLSEDGENYQIEFEIDDPDHKLVIGDYDAWITALRTARYILRCPAKPELAAFT